MGRRLCGLHTSPPFSCNSQPHDAKGEEQTSAWFRNEYAIAGAFREHNVDGVRIINGSLPPIRVYRTPGIHAADILDLSERSLVPISRIQLIG